MRSLLIASLFAAAAAAATPNLILFSDAEVKWMREAARQEEQGRRFRSAADSALTAGPWSVTFHRPKGTAAGPHDFFSEGPYWWPDPKNPSGPYIRKDGEVNPDRFLENDRDLGRMGEAVLRLGAAAFLFEDARYARKAAEILRVWFIEEKTRMNPNLECGQAIRGVTAGRGIGIIDTRPLIWVVQGIAFLERAPGWDARTTRQLRQWFREYTEWLTTSRKGLDEKKNGNNHSTWWAAQVAAYATFTRDERTRDSVWQLFRDYLIPGQFRPNGSAPHEEARTRSLSYSAMNLDGFALICRLAQNSGVDLWKFETPASASVADAAAYLLPYMRDPASWTKQQITPHKPGQNYFVGLAGLGLKQPDYVAAQRSMGFGSGAWGELLQLLFSNR